MQSTVIIVSIVISILVLSISIYCYHNQTFLHQDVKKTLKCESCLNKLNSFDCNIIIPLSTRLLSTICRQDGFFQNLTIRTERNNTFQKLYSFTQKDEERFADTVQKCIHGPICRRSWIDKHGNTSTSDGKCSVRFNYDNLLEFCFDRQYKIIHVTLSELLQFTQEELFQLYYVVKLFLKFH